MQKELEYYQLTTVGDRTINQDCTAQKVSSKYGLFVVADGLGGHHAGEKASKFFCQGLIRQADKYHRMLKNPRQNTLKSIFAQWISAAVYEMKKLFVGDEEAVNAHTTCVILYLDDDFSASIHCGDSRIYRLDEKQVLWRTKDHSLIQKQLDEGVISEREMGLHPDQHQLIRSINIKHSNPQVEVHIYPPIKPGETFLLCTDGFWEFIKENDLLELSAQMSGKKELKKIARMMHLRAKGNSDNVTVQWIRCH